MAERIITPKDIHNPVFQTFEYIAYKKNLTDILRLWDGEIILMGPIYSHAYLKSEDLSES